jgi:predicted dehydrogenase
MARIRVALIGLSQAAKTSWAKEGHLPYLLSERGKERYEIVALLNSSEDAAKRAIEAYKLGSKVKAYGSPADIAKDPDVDLVVCTTRVDVHHGTIEPSVRAGKNVFVEWPLAENVQRATELAELAKGSSSKTLIGLQARVAPATLKVKELLEAGTIGKVLSSDVQSYNPRGGGYSISEGLAYFIDKKVGGNPVTIAFGHSKSYLPIPSSDFAYLMIVIDFIHSVLGEFKSSNSHVQIQRPHQSIVKGDGTTTPASSDVPDLVSVHGTLQASANVASGASLLVTFLSGPPFPGRLPFEWVMTGEKGRIRMSNERGPFIQSEGGANIVIQVEDFATGEVKEVPWEWESWQEPDFGRGKNIAKIYDLYFEGRAEDYGVADFPAAVSRHAQLDGMLYDGN